MTTKDIAQPVTCDFKGPASCSISLQIHNIRCTASINGAAPSAMELPDAVTLFSEEFHANSLEELLAHAALSARIQCDRYLQANGGGKT